MNHKPRLITPWRIPFGIALGFLIAACGGSPSVDDDDDAPATEPEPSPSNTGPSPTPSMPTGGPSDPVLEPDAMPNPEPEGPIDPADPCESTSCNPGQRCEAGDAGASCIDNTCDDLECSETELCIEHELGGFVCDDNGCEDDVDCAPDEFCNTATMACEEDACTAQSVSCEGDSVFQCTSSGSEEEELFTCGSTTYFTSMCVTGGPDTTGCNCEDDWDCPAFTTCEVGLCQGTGTLPSCRLPPVDFADTPPTVEIHWGGDAFDNDAAHDGTPEQNPAPWASSSHIQATPMVANLDDDNGDGLINELDFPEIIFVSYPDGSDGAILRAIHGGGPNKGRDMFAVCGNTTWTEADPVDTPETCDEADIPSRNTIAIGDLDLDGTPEIVVSTDNGAIRIISHLGEVLFVSDVNLLEETTNNWGTAPAIANLNFDGLPEIVIGRDVYTLAIDEMATGDAGVGASNGLYIEHHFIGDEAVGLHGAMGPTSCVADVHPDPGQEVLAGTTLYRMPELTACASPPCSGALEVVWNGADVNDAALQNNDGYCAIADVWGADPETAPGPQNPADGRPEAILIADGWLEILDAETGTLIHQRNLEGGDDGGAPNIDDFDGDGFMEIASALSDFYVVVDLQEPSENCPEWPDLMERILVDGEEDNPNITAGLTRNPGGACTEETALDDCAADAVCNTERGACVCLHNGWKRESDDNSSRVTSSSVFDFNGDGAAEVLYNDECDFRVYDGVNGEVLYSEISRSRTAMENPVVADVDNDGNAEAITILNTEENNRCNDDNADPAGPNGLRVWGDPSDTWVSARRIWNQFAYHVTNVTEGGAVLEHPPESWREYNGRKYNTYRSQPRNFGVAPDLQVTGVSVSSPDVECGELGDTLQITFEITNAGDLRVGPGVEVAFFGVWEDMEAVLMGPGGPLTFVIQNSLEPGRSLIGTVLFDIADQEEGTLPASVRVEVDTGGPAGSDFGAERECIEDNNDNSADVVAGEPRPDLSIDVGEATVDCMARTASVEVTVTNSGTADANSVVLEIFAGDPSAGGTSMARITIDEPIPAMGSVTITAMVENFPQNRTITLWGVIDPDNTITECDEGDNSDPADNAIACNVPRTAR